MKGQKVLPLLVIAAGLLAYHNSFRGEFVHDDFGSIPENPTIRRLWPIGQALSPPHRGGLTVEGRPIINLSLAVNYALGGYEVWGYHALNLTIHILAGLTLLGIVRRTLLQPRLRDRFGSAADGLALATAILWTVHPLQTESVSYIVQRAESIMGLFYLLTLYCFIRGLESLRPRLWYGLSLTACALGMASKEVMVSAPVMVMLYDRAFVSSSFAEAWRRRWPVYLGLLCTWILLGFVLVSGQLPATSMSAQHSGLKWWEYLAIQPGVILNYLQLSVWPHPLSVYHSWPIARTWINILPPTVLIVILLAASAWAWKRNPVLGFVGAWFFLILAPSSSFIPLIDPMYEHRMYLSVAAVMSLVVVGLYSLVGRLSLIVFVVTAIGLGFLTTQRNQAYRNEVALWSDAVAKFPNNSRSQNNLGIALARAGRAPEAISHYEQALRLNPVFAGAENNLGLALQQTGRVDEAIGHFEQALRLIPDYAQAHCNLANALQEKGRVTEAIAHYRQAVQLDPYYREAHNNLGNALRDAGQMAEAVEQYEQALRINPDYAWAHYNLGLVLQQTGRVQEAIGHYEQTLQLTPDFAEAHYNLGVALVQQARVTEAIEHWKQALRIRPDYAEAHNNLGSALMGLGQVQEAIGHYERSLAINPDYVRAHYNLGTALEQTGRRQEAIQHYEVALRLAPDFAEAQKRLAQLRTAQ